MLKEKVKKANVKSKVPHDLTFLFLHHCCPETGGPALLSAVWKEDSTVNISCESGGWYPEPRLQWSDSKGDLATMSLKHSRDSSGLVSVRSWILVSSPSTISCSVGLDGQEPKEASVYMSSSSGTSDQCSGLHFNDFVQF